MGGFLAGIVTAEQPREVDSTPPDPLPPIWDQVRAGHRKRIINWPWDNYGGDFGANSWGYRGLASQGPSGWRRETQGSDGAAERLFWAQRDSNDHCLGIQVSLNDSTRSAIVYFQIDDRVDKQIEETTDLKGQSMTVELWLQPGMEGLISDI